MQFKQAFLCLFVVVLVQVPMALGICPYECDCDDEPKSCRVGVSHVMDGCNCCKVCAKQLGEQCDNEAHVCDVHRNLFCDFTASRNGNWGVCRARSGRSCFLDDIFMTSGTMFLQSCKKKCWCIDGAVGCVPNCPHETHVPRSDRCPNARLQSVPGRCCDQWTCTSASGDVFTLPMNDVRNGYVDYGDVIANRQGVETSEIGNDIRESVIYEDDIGENGEEIQDVQLHPTSNVNGFSKLINKAWHRTNVIPGDVDAQLQTQLKKQSSSRCKKRASSWSPCSKTCGLGVSMRVTNSNPRCRLAREQRLCEIRPCNNDPRYQPKKSQQCLRHKKSRKRAALTYAGCVSVRKIKQRFCGSCHDTSRCCLPKDTRMSRLLFRCEDGRSFTKKVVIIESCHCPKKCPFSKAKRRGVRFILQADMHRMRES